MRFRLPFGRVFVLLSSCHVSPFPIIVDSSKVTHAHTARTFDYTQPYSAFQSSSSRVLMPLPPHTMATTGPCR